MLKYINVSYFLWSIIFNKKFIKSIISLVIVIECNDRNSLVNNVMDALSSFKVKITEFSAKLHPETSTTTISAQIYVTNTMMLEQILSTLRNINSVYQVKRVIH